MKLDETIKSLELSADTWQDPFTDKELRQIAKWLKELKKLREFKKHCELVHGTFFDELAKQGVIT